MNPLARLPPGAAAFRILMIGAAVSCFLVPERFTGWLRGVVQPLRWASGPMTEAGRTLAGRSDESTLTLDSTPNPRAALAELERLTGHQSLELQQLRERLAETTGLRERLGAGGAVIIPARIIALDAAWPRRQTIRISEGHLRRRPVQGGQWVVAARGGAESTVAPRDLLREWVIGRVTEVRPYESTVQLVSDAGFGPLPVGLARHLADGTWQPVEGACLLQGMGGWMQIDRVKEDYFAQDCRVVLVPAGPTLPTAFTIGKVVRSQRIAEAPLHFDLEVRPWAAVELLSDVYVISVGG